MTTLVTGATGYLGGYALFELLSRGEPCLALVRAQDEPTALERLWHGLQLHASAPWLAEQLRAGRLGLVRGDLRQPWLGLQGADRERVLAECDGVVNAAASLSRRSHRACFDVNLRGGLEVIELCRALLARGRLRRLTHVSTTAVAGKRRREVVDEERAIEWERSDWDPYGRSKKLLEHMIARLLPAEVWRVVRPSTVLGDARFPETTQFEMVRAFVALARAPLLPVDPGLRLDIVNADWVGRAVARLHLLERPRHAVYHLSAGEGSTTFGQVTAALARDLGLRPPRFAPRLGGAAGPLFTALGALPGPLRGIGALLQAFWPYLEWDVVFANQRAVSELGEAPVPFHRHCAGLFRFAREGGFRYPHQPLPPLLREALAPAREAATRRPLPVVSS